MRSKAIVWLWAGALAASVASAETIYVSTTTRLLSFDSASPGTVTGDLAVAGLVGGATLEGIDFRPATGELYGLDSLGRLYRIDPATAVATPVGDAIAVPGTRYGMDFNPTVDRIRIVSNSGANVRRHPDTGALVATDGGLAYAAGDPNEGDPAGAGGAAYTNSLAGATSTVLYDLELTNQSLVTQVPPNDGQLNTVGALDHAVTDGFAGFDIAYGAAKGWAAYDAGDGTRLHEIDLVNGRATPRGAIAGSPLVTGLAIAPSEGPCLPTTTALCLQGDRFRVTATWETPAGDSGPARFSQLSHESGLFTFFEESNLEGSIKIIDGCSNNDFYWVFASGLTNLEVSIRVEDLESDAEFFIFNPQGQLFSTIASIQALPCD
jgi:hypothetical protein